jgi:hypothetical protein
MLVASPSSGSKSRSLRLAPAVADVATDMSESAGEGARARREVAGCRVGGLDVVVFRAPGRMLDRSAPGRDGGAMDVFLRAMERVSGRL